MVLVYLYFGLYLTRLITRSKLLTHLYSYFGGALGCSQYGMGSFPAYSGQGSQYTVHK